MATHPNPFAVVVLEVRNLLALVLLGWAIVRVMRVPTGRVRPPAGLREIVTGRRPIPARMPSRR